MSVKEILQNAGFRIVLETADYYRMKPLHRKCSTNTCLSVSKKTGSFTDFGSNERGSLEHLIRLTTGGKIDFEPTPNDLDDLKEEISISFNKEEIKALLPSYSFYNKKGISNETLALFQGGFCQGGKMYNRFVFPIINPNEELVGLSGRNILPKKDDKWIKWKHLGKKGKWLYPLKWSSPDIHKSKEIILVESIGNMLALWEAGYHQVLICFGTAMSKELLSAIIGANPSRVILALDTDTNNAGQKGSAKIHAELIKWFDKSKICVKIPPIGQDLGDLWQHGGQRAIDEWYKL